ncbi:MAG TPA: hypothetical protein VLC53_16600, partial [Myxococcota bacterium]|nr:hypothetical protein [Myxococcota bacterium]
MTFQPDRPRSKLPALLILLTIFVAILVAGGLYLRPRFESAPPTIALTSSADTLGPASTVEILVTDAGSGLQSVTATLTAGGTEHTLASESYDEPVGEKRITLALSKVAGLKEGPAVLRVRARDRSLANSFDGNEAVAQRELTIDATAPTLELVAPDRYVNFGGAGAIVYKSSPDTAASGVRIGKHFFHGFQGPVEGQPEHYFALFAHPYDTPAEARAVLVATDKAGNTREMPLAYELMNVRYRKSDIALTERFIANKVAPLLGNAAERQGTPRDVFVAVNKRLRKDNEDKIAEITRKATPSILWKGAFAQLSNSKVEANFAD